MPVWVFEIRQNCDEKVQGVGLRPFAVSQMLEHGFERGDAVNLPDGKSVSVLVECKSKREALDFRQRLAAEIKNEAKSEYSNLPEKFIVSALEKQNSHNHSLAALHNKAPAMTLSQTTKGVGVMVAMHKEMRGGFEGLRGDFKGLRGEMRDGFGNLRKEMHQGFSKLPERIAKAIASAK